MTALRFGIIVACSLLSQAAFAGGSVVGVLTAPNGHTQAVGVGAASVSVGAGGAVTTRQNGSTNALGAIQVGPRNSLTSFQTGRNNSAWAVQKGPNNAAGFSQTGARNRVDLQQRR